MLSLAARLRSSASLLRPSILSSRRTLATPAEDVPTEEESSEPKKTGGPLRPHLGIETDPNHGLYAFFRKVTEGTQVKYETLESTRGAGIGRSWTAAELRRKSFVDLHTLWYVLLRERNLLATQLEEGRRIGGAGRALFAADLRSHSCRKSMARLKYVLNERRLAYEGARAIHEQNREELRRKPALLRQKKKRAELRKAIKNKRDRQADIVMGELGILDDVQKAKKSQERAKAKEKARAKAVKRNGAEGSAEATTIADESRQA